MKSRDDIEKVLERFGNEWPEDGSIVERVVQAIESAPVRKNSRHKGRLIMKSLFAAAASLTIVASLWWGFVGNGNSLYAQVTTAVRQARTLHTIQYVQPKDADEPVRVAEAWYERGVGFRHERPNYVRIGNKEHFWTLAKDRKVATRSRSDGIEKATEPLFSEIDRLARQLQDEFERYPEGDLTIEGRACQAYLLTKLDRYADSGLKAGERRVLIFLDEESRLVRTVFESRHGDDWRTESFSDWKYDEPINRAMFQPNFGDDVKIVDADEAFDAFADPASAAHSEQRDGLIYAIHHAQRFENGGVLVVSSVRGTADTLKEFPLTKHRFRPDLFYVAGPAKVNTSPQGFGWLRLELAEATHQGIDVRWWVMIPRGTPPNHFDVSPGRIKLNVGASPSGEYAKARRADERGIMAWDVELDVPRPARLPTLEEIANRVYADHVALDSVPTKWLQIGYYGENKTSEVDDISPAEYAKAVANNIRSWLKAEIEFQLKGQFAPALQKPRSPGSDDDVAIGLSYQPLVDNSTLARVAKHGSLTRLYLRGTRITDNGLKHLNGLTKLEKLDLAETGITDAGLVHLSGLSSLKKLYVRETRVTQAGVRNLKQALPNVEIDWQNDKP